MLIEICAWRQKYPLCGCVIDGDINSDLDLTCNISDMINKFLTDNQFLRCKSANSLPYTFVNESRNYFSNIDYIVYNDVLVNNFTVVEPDINFSDHLPVCASCVISFIKLHQAVGNNRHKSTEQYLRWDHADLLLYYNITRDYLQPILNELSDLESFVSDCVDISHADSIYERTVAILKHCADILCSKTKKDFFKFWWSQELNCLKTQAIESNKLWQNAGRPRSGPIYCKRM